MDLPGRLRRSPLSVVPVAEIVAIGLPGCGKPIVDQSTLQTCQDLIGYHFNDLTLLDLALRHASVADHRLRSNERLEFLGDAVLGLVVVHDLYHRYEDLMEGEMTKIKSAVVSRHTCAVVADEIGLTDCLSLGKGMDATGGVPRSVSAAAFESVIGAIYVDGGLEPTRDFIIRNTVSHIEEAFANEHQRNFKSMLQQHAQRQWGTTPDYRLLDEKGPDHSKCFEIGVVINGRHFQSAWGTNKKLAEQEAARRALIDLDLLDDDNDPGEAED
ncbi:MAG: ribonuclease III [Planctomycetota bacterium]|jgi:ribonuclease-3